MPAAETTPEGGVLPYPVAPPGWVLVGYMPGPALSAETGVGPRHEEYLSTVEMMVDDGGIRPEYVDRVVPIYARQEDIDNAT